MPRCGPKCDRRAEADGSRSTLVPLHGDRRRRTMNTTVAAGSSPSRDENQPRVTPFTRRATGDRDEAEQIITELYLPNRLDLSEGSAPLDMNVAGLRLGALTAGRLTY